MFPTSGLQNSKIILELKKLKKRSLLFFYFFLILETLISRIKKITKNGAFCFLIFLILETLISGIKKDKKIKKIIVSNFKIPRKKIGAMMTKTQLRHIVHNIPSYGGGGQVGPRNAQLLATFWPKSCLNRFRTSDSRRMKVNVHKKELLGKGRKHCKSENWKNNQPVTGMSGYLDIFRSRDLYSTTGGKLRPLRFESV